MLTMQDVVFLYAAACGVTSFCFGLWIRSWAWLWVGMFMVAIQGAVLHLG